MPYVAKLFRELNGRDLSGLSHFTGWIGIGGYYHWRVVQQGLVHHVPHLAGQPAPRTPNAHPSGKSLPSKLSQTETPSTGASGKQLDRSQPAPGGSRQEPTPSQGGWLPISGQSGRTAAPKQSGKSSTPCEGGEPALTGGGKVPAASGGPSNCPPPIEEEQATVPELTGSKCTCARPRVGSLNPQRLRTQLGWRKREKRPLVTFMTEWPEKNHPRITLPLGP